MKFKDKKEYYSLRKFKGVGLASALVGLAFLTAPSVLADETAANSNNSNISTITQADTESNQPTLESIASTTSKTPVEPKEETSNIATENKSQENVVTTSTTKTTSEEAQASAPTEEPSKALENKENKPSEASEQSTTTQPVRSRSKRDTSSQESSQESPYVSDKAKEVSKELSDTLVMTKEDTASTSKTLFKLDAGITPTDDEKAYNQKLAQAFDEYPELVRSQVHSLTFVREPNGMYGFTYSKSGDVNINMQYYHPELTGNEPGSINQYLGVLGHELGHIMNARSFRDNDTWSYSRDPKYAELAKEVYGSDENRFLISRWASDFADYVSYLRGDYKPQGSAQKVMTYMDGLFKGILTPREDHITPELKAAVDSVNAGSSKKLVYDGHVELVADYRNLDEVKQTVQTLNSNEITKVSSKSSTHYKTYGYKTLVTTKYTSGGANIAETTITDQGSVQQNLPGYNFVDKEVTHDGLLVEYKYTPKNTYSLDNEKLSADLDIQTGDSYIGDRNKANLRFTLKEQANNLSVSYKIQNLTTGVWQTLNGTESEASVDSTNLKNQAKRSNSAHNLGSVETGYHATADLTYTLFTGAHGNNVYRMTATFFDGATELGSVSKDFVGKVAASKKDDLQDIELKSQVDLHDGKTIGAIIKNGNVYRPYIGAIGHLNPETKLANLDIAKARDEVYKNHGEVASGSQDNRVRYTILNENYRLNDIAAHITPVFKDMKDETTNRPFGSQDLDTSASKKDALGYTVATYNINNLGVTGITDTWGTFSYVGNDKTSRTDNVPIKIEILKVLNGKETVIDSKIVTKNVEIVNYNENLKPFFAEDYQIDRRASVGLATKSDDQYKIYYGRYGTNLETVRTWSFDKWNETSSDSVESYRLSEIDPNKHIFLENMISLNIKNPNDAIFSDADYTVHFDVFKRGDGKPLNFAEIDLTSYVNRTPILTPKEYKETVYWLDASGTRHKIGLEVSKAGEVFKTRYAIPTNAKSIEIDISGKVPVDYGPSYLVQYITDDTFEKVKNENRYLNSNDPLIYDSRAYTVTASLTDKILNKKRDFTNHTIVRNSEVLALQVNPAVTGANNNNIRLNQPFRLISDQVALANSNGQLTANDLLNTTDLLDEYPAKRFMLLEDGVRVSDSDWTKQSSFDFAGKTYALYTRPWTESKDLNESDFTTNIVISPSSSNLITNKNYDAYTGVIYKLKEGVSLSPNLQPWSAQLVSDAIEHKRLDQKILSVLGETSNNDQTDTVRLNGVKLDLKTKRSLEFTVNQTVEDSEIVTRDYAKSAGKQVDIVTTLSNGAQTTSPTLEVIQKLPVGDLSYTFVDPKENNNYNIFYTSDTDVTVSSNWVSAKPTNVTGLKWVRKSALNTGTIDKVAYTIQVANDKFKVTKSVASATMLNGGLVGSINDVVIRNDQAYRTLKIQKQTYTAGGHLVENITTNILSLPVGEEVPYRGTVLDYLLNSYVAGSATQTSTDYTLPKPKITWDGLTFTVPDRDTTMVFKFVQPAEPQEARRTYTTTWENGYVEPDIQELQNLFGNVRSYEFLPNESTQAVKKFNLTYVSGQKGIGYVDIKIEPKREKVVGTHKGITYQGDDSKDLGYETTINGVNPSYEKVTSYPVDSTGTFSEVVSKENEVAAKDAIIVRGTKPTVKTDTIPKGKRYEADPDQPVKGKETVIEGQNGVKTSTTRYTVNPTTGDITSNTTVENTAKVDTVVKIGNKEILTEPISIVTKYKAEPTLEKDVQETETTGQAGSREITVTYDVNAADGTLSNPTRTTREAKSMTPTIIKVGSVHKDVVETEITTKYISDDTKVRDSREELVAGSKGVKTTTTTYLVDENTGATHSPTTQVDDQPMIQKVVKIGTKPTVDVQTVAITTKYIFDDKLAYGQRIIDENGSEGRVVTTTTYTMNESDGTTTADTPDVQTVAMKQRVIRVGIKPTVEETPINFNTFYEPDPKAEKDSRIDKIAGKVGKVTTTTTYSYDETTGVVTPNTPTTVKEDAVDRIVKVGTRPNVVETPIDFTTTYEADPESPRDIKTDKVVGKKGTTTVTTTYSVDPKTGVVTENPSTTTVKDPVNAVIKVGTKSTEVVEVLPSPKRFVKDSTRPKDENPVTEQGRPGSKTTVTTYTVDPRTGVTTPNEQPPVTIDPTDTIVRVPAGNKVVEEKIAITTRYIEDPTKDFGYEEEISKGSEGKIVTTTTYNVDGQTGIVTDGDTTRVQTDMVQRVVRKGTKPKVEETPIHFTTRYEKDGTKPEGERTDFVIGVNGKVVTTTTYTLNPTTGQVTENPSTSETINPTTHIVKVGAKDKVEVTPIELVTRYERDDELVVGKSTIVNAGKAGSITTTTTYDVNPTTGDVTESGKTSVTDNMVEKVVKVGTKPTVTVDTRPINIRYIPKEDVSYGTRTVKSEGSATVITSTTNYTLNPNGSTTANTPVVTTTDGNDRVIEVGVQTSSVTIELPYNVETTYDTSLEAGQTVIDQNGENGSKTTTTTYSLNETTGDVTSNTTETSVQPKPKKVRIGTGVRSTNVRNIIHDVPFETETIKDRFLPKGKEVVEHEGALGKDIETIVEQLFNGEVKSSESSTQRVLDPVKRVVRIGTYEFAKPTDAPIVEIPEFNGGVSPIDPPVVEIPEYTDPIGSNDSDGEGNIIPAPIVEIPEFNGGVNPIDPPVVEIPDYTGQIGGNGLDGEGNIIPAPIVEIPEFNGGVNPIDPPVVEIPEYTGQIGGNGLDGEGNIIPTPVVEIPEFNGGVNPIDPPVVEIPEYTGPINSNDSDGKGNIIPAPIVDVPEFKGDVNPIDAPVVEIPESNSDTENNSLVKDEKNTLPNTGSHESYILSLLGGLSLASLLGFISKKRKKQ